MSRKHTDIFGLSALLLGLAACSSPSPDPTPTPSVVAATPTPTPSPNDDPVTTAAKTTIIGYYKDQGYLFQNPGDGDLNRVQRWRTDPYSLKAAGEVTDMRRRGFSTRGDILVRDIQVSLPPADHGAGLQVSARYCLDAERMTVVKADGSTQPPAYPTLEKTAVLRLVDDKWLLDGITDVSEKC